MLHLRTPRLLLREFVPADVEAVYAITAQPVVTRYTSFGPHTPADAQRFIERALASAQEQPRVHYYGALALQDQEPVIGWCNLHRIQRAPTGGKAELAFGLHPRSWGCGYMTEAVRAVLAFGFEQLGLHRLFATVHPDNLASLRLLERVGMQREGVLRQEAFIKGEWWDVVSCALLVSEWQTCDGVPTVPDPDLA
jgi:ribosomal-protein-alanine N-acetyltransferase